MNAEHAQSMRKRKNSVGVGYKLTHFLYNVLAMDSATGELYVASLAEFIKHGMSVFKFGRSYDTRARMSGYPKGSRIVAFMPVGDMMRAEQALLAICRSRFTSRTDYGSEYFECAQADAITTLCEAARLFPAPHPSEVESGAPADPLASEEHCDADEAVEARPLIDGTLLLMEFVRSRIDVFRIVPAVDTSLFLDELLAFYRYAGCKATPSFKGIVLDLRRYFDARELPLFQFSDGSVRHAMSFVPAEPVEDRTERRKRLRDTDNESIAHGALTIAEWLKDRVFVTGNPDDRVCLGDLGKQYGSEAPNDFIRIVVEYFSSCVARRECDAIASFKKIDNVKAKGSWDRKRNVMRGVRMLHI